VGVGEARLLTPKLVLPDPVAEPKLIPEPKDTVEPDGWFDRVGFAPKGEGWDCGWLGWPNVPNADPELEEREED